MPIKTLAMSVLKPYIIHSSIVERNLMSADDNSRNSSKNNRADELSPAYAVALGYDQEKHNAPVVLAKGQGEVAERIIRIALDNDIEIHQDADLLQILKAVDIDAEIPVEAFAAVAEIISYIYRQNAKTAE